MTEDFKKWLLSAGVRCILVEVGVKVDGVETTRYLSNRVFTTKPTDTPANTAYTSRITGGFSFSRAISIGNESNLSFGSIDMHNVDGQLDDWLEDVWALRPIKIYMGAPYWPRSMFELVFSGTVEDIAPKSRSVLSLKLRDVLAPLNAPVTTAVVGGGGDNKDSIIPIAVGEVFNITPLLVSTIGDPVYRVSQGAVERIIEIRDNGYPISATTSAGTGTFTLTNARYGTITCDVQGVLMSGTYKNSVGDIVEALATSLGDGQKLLESDLDTDAIASFKTAHTQPVGYYISDRVNRLQAMQEVANSVGAVVSCSLGGKVKLVKLEFSTPTITISEANMIEGSFQPASKSPVKGAVQLAGCRNWTPQETSSLAASLPIASLPLLSEEYTVVKQEDVAVVADYKQSAPAQEDTLLCVESDVQAEALRRLNLWKVPRRTFRFTCFSEMFDIELGQTITLTHPRFGLAAGKPAIVVALATDFMAGKVDMEVLV